MSFENGVERLLTEIISGVVASAFINAIPDPLLRIILNLIVMLGFIELLSSMEYWGTTYMLGWFFGMILFSSTGMISFWEFIAYISVVGIVIYHRFSKGD